MNLFIITIVVINIIGLNHHQIEHIEIFKRK